MSASCLMYSLSAAHQDLIVEFEEAVVEMKKLPRHNRRGSAQHKRVIEAWKGLIGQVGRKTAVELTRGF